MSASQPSVSKEALRPGDLVFFKIGKRPVGHVGIYAGDNKFVHATSSRTKRVEVSDLGQDYWKRRFVGASRVPTLD